MYNQGETVIVTEKISKTEERHSVGVIMKPFIHKKQTFYDVLLERRTALSYLNTARSSKQAFINKDLTKKLVETGDIESTIPFKAMLDNEQLPIIIA
tara:strand:+ start:198 stop:488 length:291 start_codon:yes stop_codon:yes gene_type:complete